MYNQYSMLYAPVNFEQQNWLDGTRAPSAVKHNSVAYSFWCRCLYQRLCSTIKFDNLPVEWRSAKDFLEWCLFSRGFVAVFDSSEFGLSFQPCTLSGYDFYYQPTKALVANPYLNKEFTIGKDAQLIKMSPDYIGCMDIVTYYAEKLATLDSAINMAIINSKFAYVLAAKNKASARAIQSIFDKINKGEPLVVYDQKITEDLAGDEPFTFIDRAGLKNSYLTPELLQDWKTLLNNFCNEIGIPNLGAAEKKERMISSEVESLAADSNARVSLWKESLENSLELVNEMFGTDIKFEFVFLEQAKREQEAQNKLSMQEVQYGNT